MCSSDLGGGEWERRVEREKERKDWEELKVVKCEEGENVSARGCVGRM